MSLNEFIKYASIFKKQISPDYILPIASSTILGGVKVGRYLTINGSGTLDVNLAELSIGGVVVVNSEAEMLAIPDARVGITAVRLDSDQNFILQALPASIFANWVLLRDRLGVVSVFGRTLANIEAQHGDYNTDLVPEGEDPLRKYFTQTRFDDAFDARFPVAFDNILVDYRNQPNGLLGLDIDKVAEAADFRLSNPSQTLQTLYNSIGKANGIVPLNDLKQIDPQYLPPMPSGYTDDDARAALAAPDFDKILGIKNTAVDSASMVSNTANLYIDSSGNEYLQHKIGSAVKNRRFAMHGTDVGFSKVGVAATGGTQSVFQINSYADSLPNFSYTNNLPLLINTTIRNWQGGALTGFQDALSIFVPGFPGQSYGSVFRFRVGGYAKTDQQIRSALDIYTSYYAPTSEAEILKNHSVRFSWDGVALSARPSAPHNNALFNNSMAFYTDSTQDYYIGRVRKNNGTVVNASPLLSASTTAPDFSSATVPNNSLAFYTDSTQGYYIGRIKKDKDTVVDAGAVPRLSYGMPSHTNTLPKDALIFFYDERHNVICGGRNHTAGSLFEESFVIRASALEPSFDKMLIGGQMQFYVVQYASKFDLYVKIKSMHSNIADTTFKLATSI